MRVNELRANKVRLSKVGASKARAGKRGKGRPVRRRWASKSKVRGEQGMEGRCPNLW